MKLGWFLRNDVNNLWCQVPKGKYARQDFSANVLVAKPHDSPIWKVVAEIWPHLVEGELWAIGDGRLVDVWEDRWLNNGVRLASTDLNTA